MLLKRRPCDVFTPLIILFKFYPGLKKTQFDWIKYLKSQSSVAAPQHLFRPVLEKKHNFEIGLKLEAIDRKNPDLICVATVTNVIGNRFLVHFDEWDDTYDYWCEEDCPYIHPIRWCHANGGKLNPPNGTSFVFGLPVSRPEKKSDISSSQPTVPTYIFYR